MHTLTGLPTVGLRLVQQTLFLRGRNLLLNPLLWARSEVNFNQRVELLIDSLTYSTLWQPSRDWRRQPPRTYPKDSKGHGSHLPPVVDIGASFAYNRPAPQGGNLKKENANGNQESPEDDQAPEEGEEARSNQASFDQTRPRYCEVY